MTNPPTRAGVVQGRPYTRQYDTRTSPSGGNERRFVVVAEHLRSFGEPAVTAVESVRTTAGLATDEIMFCRAPAHARHEHVVVAVVYQAEYTGLVERREGIRRVSGVTDGRRTGPARRRRRGGSREILQPVHVFFCFFFYPYRRPTMLFPSPTSAHKHARAVSISTNTVYECTTFTVRSVLKKKKKKRVSYGLGDPEVTGTK